MPHIAGDENPIMDKRNRRNQGIRSTNGPTDALQIRIDTASQDCRFAIDRQNLHMIQLRKEEADAVFPILLVQSLDDLHDRDRTDRERANGCPVAMSAFDDTFVDTLENLGEDVCIEESLIHRTAADRALGRPWRS